MANTVLYGFGSLRDSLTEAITVNNVSVVNTAIEQSVAEHNRQMDALMALFVQSTTDHQVRYKQISGSRLQPLDEFGRARPVQPSGYYDVAFPMKDAGIALGHTFKSLAKMTIGDANRETAMMLLADKAWVRDQILGALFQNAAYNFIDPLYGTLSIKPLAITSDGQTYARVGSTATATDQHYLAQANAIATGADDPFDALVAELTEHPENSGEVVALVPTSNVAAVQALPNFYEVVDPDITLGSGSARLTGSLGTAIPGRLLGKHTSGAWIVEWTALPANYLIAVQTGSEKPVAMRQEPEAQLQGFYKVPTDRNDHPYYEQQWARHAGFGIWNRVGAAVQRVGNGTYAIPTGYTQPMP